MSTKEDAPKLRTVNAPKHQEYRWPAGQVQVSVREGKSSYETQIVYLDGEEIGKLETNISTPRVKIAKGSRIGKDLKPRRVWKSVDSKGRTGLNRETLSRAVLDVIEERAKAAE